MSKTLRKLKNKINKFSIRISKTLWVFECFPLVDFSGTGHFSPESIYTFFTHNNKLKNRFFCFT